MSTSTFSSSELALLALPPVILAVFVAKQAVRSRLVAALFALRSPLATAVSDWTYSGGYWWAVKSEFIWGESSRLLRAIPEVAWSVPVLRGLLVAQHSLYIALALLFYLVFLHGKL